MNCKIKCVENQGRNGEYMYAKWKSIVAIAWNNFAGIKFTSIIWRPSYGEFFYFYYSNEQVFLQFLLLYYRWKSSYEWFFLFFNLEI
jgi:hypothetical protein